jgi:endoglucanase
MNEYGISYVAWNLSNKDETSAILKPSCEKTEDFGYEELSESGQWLYRMLTVEQTAENDVEKSGSDSEWSGGTVSDAASEIALTEQGLTLHISQTNNWPDGDGTAYQYNVTLENTSDQEYDDWEIEIPFAESFQLKDGWNGTYTPEDNILRIKAKEYNSAIPAGGKVTDIGFIVNGGGGVLLHE